MILHRAPSHSIADPQSLVVAVGIADLVFRPQRRESDVRHRGLDKSIAGSLVAYQKLHRRDWNVTRRRWLVGSSRRPLELGIP